MAGDDVGVVAVVAVEAFDTGLVLPLSVSGPLLCGKPVVGKSVFRGTVGLGANRIK